MRRGESSHTNISANGLEKKNECGRRSIVFRDDRTLAPKVVVPDAFSMMPLCFISILTSNSCKPLSYLSIIVMIGAIRTPALAAAKASVPILNPRFRVFQAFVSFSVVFTPGIAFTTGVVHPKTSPGLAAASPTAPPLSFIWSSLVVHTNSMGEGNGRFEDQSGKWLYLEKEIGRFAVDFLSSRLRKKLTHFCRYRTSMIASPV